MPSTASFLYPKVFMHGTSLYTDMSGGPALDWIWVRLLLFFFCPLLFLFSFIPSIYLYEVDVESAVTINKL